MDTTGKRLSVLLVEDDVNDVYLIVKHLKQHWSDLNYERVYTLDSLSVALKLNWDVILCDFSLPGFDGMTAFRLIRESGVNVPFILVSGQVSEDVAALMMRLGANDYVFKNNLGRLAPAILRELKYNQQVKEEAASDNTPKEKKQSKRNPINKLLPPLVGSSGEDEQSKPIPERHKAIVNLLFVTEFIRKQQAEVLEKQNLTAPQLNILRILRRISPDSITIKGIQKEMIYKTVDISRIISKMNKEGLINAGYNPKKKTSKEIIITTQGIEVLNAADKYSDEMFLPERYLSEENAKQINEALQGTLSLIR